MNRGPIHIAYGRVDERDDTDFDCIDSEQLPMTESGYVEGEHVLIRRHLPNGQMLMVVARVAG